MVFGIISIIAGTLYEFLIRNMVMNLQIGLGSGWVVGADFTSMSLVGDFQGVSINSGTQ